MTTSAKAVNYTETQTADLKARYAAGESVVDLAKAFGKTTRSIVAKLSREGVYKAKEYVSKTSEKPVAKEQIIEQIANLLGVESEKLGGLEKANKAALKLIFDGLVK
jgi:hypothetical protein